jgi:hypothetical protein
MMIMNDDAGSTVTKFSRETEKIDEEKIWLANPHSGFEPLTSGRSITALLISCKYQHAIHNLILFQLQISSNSNNTTFFYA